MPNIVVHDTRLEGVPPRGAIQVDGTTALRSLLARLASGGRIDRLAIMCHGGHGSGGDPRIMSVNDTGLQLCRENLTLNNVSDTRVLAGKVERIILYVCKPAVTHAHEAGTVRDGWRLCQSLATWTGAAVVASTATQRFDQFPRGTRDWFGTMGQGILHWGHWEGALWEFSPGGGARRLQ
jgi:hypothetical protein